MYHLIQEVRLKSNIKKYKTVESCILCRTRTLPLTVRKEHTLKVCGNSAEVRRQSA
jgi:hypothetical protein